MRRIALVWENFGPLHRDRCQSVADRLGDDFVYGIELFSKSSTYSWESEHNERDFSKITLFPGTGTRGPGELAVARGIASALAKVGASHVFLCHYERPSVLVAALQSRLVGRRVFVMGCSKFDDKPRNAAGELAKSLFFLPYQGAIAGGMRSIDYFRFHGIPQEKIFAGYNSVSTARIRRLSGSPPAPDGVPFADRHYTVVARLVGKKNLSLALQAYARYAAHNPNPRRLVMAGDGPLEQSLRQEAARLGLTELVDFKGFVQTADVARILASTLTLILPSIEEQFGNVVAEAFAAGIPALATKQCGACDELLRTGTNGFLFEPDNAAGLAVLMELVGKNEGLWRTLCTGAQQSAPLGDASRFADAVVSLVEPSQGRR